MGNYDYSNIPIGYYDKIVEKGLKKNRGFQATWHHYKFIKVKEAMGDYNSHLDIACGPGTFIGKYLNEKSEGWDVSSEQINYAKQEYAWNKENFKIVDSKNGLKSNKKFDVITILEFIEHISPEEVLSSLDDVFSMLNDGGKIILTTPNYSGLWLLIEKMVSLFGPVDYKDQHINRYTKKRVMAELPYDNIQVKKYINTGIFLSFFNRKIGLFVNGLIGKTFNNFFGYSLLIEIRKNS
tara:strand:+ start:152 stop:865 length:714 start_codon:yes stop_codon:yes gene_type:complete